VIFYQEESPIFHPKIYLFEGKNEIKLIIGSSNLTARGLFGNVEISLLVEFTERDTQGNELLSKLKDYYSGLFDFSDPNLFRISDEVIQGFIDKGVVPIESLRHKKHGKQPTEGKKVEKESGLRIPKRAQVKIPKEFRGKSRTSKKAEIVLKELEIPDIIQIELGSLV
jgi:phosphatidylserine/phosphatidylglycerophosphate/cardiolipin synthase-like enzyme